ncbi:hypothetical protein [uncultured Methanoregula sp.]|uniref:hypothetical protein n=1 Tax=uncultured Methanoregula sp. TaxID=1005933 RepID=UPI002AAA87B7|nr:hypothetical protein [uncultured Methanoregula sp.]
MWEKNPLEKTNITAERMTTRKMINTIAIVSLTAFSGAIIECQIIVSGRILIGALWNTAGAATTCLVKQFGIVSVGKFFGIFGLVWGFLMGVIIALGLTGMGSTFAGHMLGFSVGLVVMTVLGGVPGFIGGAIVAVIYNVVPGASGGVEMDLEVKG